MIGGKSKVAVRLDMLGCAHVDVYKRQIVRPERIVRRALRNTTFHATLFISLATLADIGTSSLRL